MSRAVDRKWLIVEVASGALKWWCQRGQAMAPGAVFERVQYGVSQSSGGIKTKGFVG